MADETWIHQYDPESEMQLMQWLSKALIGPIKFNFKRPVQKVMATVFWNLEGIIFIDFLKDSKTITGIYYEGVLKKFEVSLIEKRPGTLHRVVLFYHENAPAYFSRVVRAFLREFCSEILRHPPYSLNLASSDFYIFQAERTPQRNTIADK